MSGYEDMVTPIVGDNILAQIAQTARDVIAAEADVVKAEEALKAAQSRVQLLKEATLPDLMENAGQKKLTTIDGYVVEVKDVVRGKPSKEREPEAFAWLRKFGHGGIIKTALEADLGRVDPKVLQKAVKALSRLNITAQQKDSVHHQTLGALVRELLERGESVPFSTLGVSVTKAANVSPTK